MRILIVFISLLTFGCAHKAVFNQSPTQWNEKPNESVSMSVDWIKKKHLTKMDAFVAVTNNYPFPVLITAKSLKITLGGEIGIVARNNPEWLLGPGERATTIVSAHWRSSNKVYSDQFAISMENLYKRSAADENKLAPIRLIIPSNN